MYMQTSPTEYIFSCHEVVLPTFLIQAYSITSGLPHTTFIFDDQEPIQWLIDNNIEYKNESTGEYSMRMIKLLSLEDAMAFILRWT